MLKLIMFAVFFIKGKHFLQLYVFIENALLKYENYESPEGSCGFSKNP